ncbi:hypothetical protein GCM10009765_23830 [Fodinicola feengrottensis]|uniref:Uncharacterized protein n=1 Tax=Fodinicola feengrottensis TaxID=435914 RepID=A0ABN2GP14_9ACTN
MTKKVYLHDRYEFVAAWSTNNPVVKENNGCHDQNGADGQPHEHDFQPDPQCVALVEFDSREKLGSCRTLAPVTPTPGLRQWYGRRGYSGCIAS